MKLLGKIGGYGVVAALVALAGYMIFDQWSSTQALKEKLAETEERLVNLGIDHRDTMDALNKAQRSREEIYERARKQEQELARVLALDPLADQPVPDDWRMCLQWDEDGNCEVFTARKPADRDPDSGSQPDSDSGRHGSDHR